MGIFSRRAEEPFTRSILRIERMPTTLKPGWDGHGAAVPGEAICTVATNFLRRVAGKFGTDVPEPTVVAPTSDGGVSVEWRLKTPSEAVELVFLPNDLHEYTVRDIELRHIEQSDEGVSVDDLFEVVKLIVAGRDTVLQA